MTNTSGTYSADGNALVLPLETGNPSLSGKSQAPAAIDGKSHCLPHLALFFFLAVALVGCVSAPHEVARLHDQEGLMLKDLRRTHLAMVDAFVDKKVEVFEAFYFKEYGPKFRTNWETAFKAKTGRNYDADRDFSQMYNDLVATYENNVEPLNKLRAELHEQIGTAHDQVAQAHQTVGAWIHSVEKLTTVQRNAANKLLGTVSPSLSLEKIDAQFDAVSTKIISRLKQ